MKAITLFIVFALSLPAFSGEIKNTNKPQKGQWDFNKKKVWSVAKVGEDLLAMVKKIEVDKNGNVFVFDTKLKQFFVIDKDGKFKYKFGSVGEGPGEYQYMLRFFLLKNSIAACGMKKIHFFSKRGKPGRISTLREQFSPTPKAFLDHLRFLRINTDRTDNETQNIELYNIDSRKSTLLVKIVPENNIVKINKSNTVIFSGAKHTNSLILCLNNNHIFYGKNDRYAVTKMDLKGKSLMCFSVSGKSKNKIPLSYKLKTTAKLKKFAPEAMYKGALKSIPDFSPYFSDIHVDENGFIYILITNLERPDTQEIDIFSPEGNYLYNSIIRFPEEFAIISRLTFKGNHLYVFLEDDEGGVALEKYEIKSVIK